MSETSNCLGWRSALSDWRLWFCLTLFFLLRAPLLDRELVFEESLWIGGAKSLISGEGYKFYFGEFDKQFSGFHKPPLISLLLAGSNLLLGNETNSAFRMVPLILHALVLVVLLQCARLLTGSALRVGLLFVGLPYLVVSSTYIQTDTTVGILGYALVVWWLLLVASGSSGLGYFIAFVSSLWLVLGKTEIFVISATLSVLCSMLAVVAFRQPIRKWAAALGVFVIGGMAGVSAVYLFSEIVTNSSEGFWQIYQTVLSASKGIPIARDTAIVERLAAAWANVKAPILSWNLQWLWILGLVSFVLAITARRANGGAEKLLLLIVFGSAVLPLGVYLIGGYLGGSFPRTVVITTPSIILLVGLTSSVSRRIHLLASILAIFILLQNAEKLLAVERDPQSWTEFVNIQGFEETGRLLKAALPPNTAIFANDPIGFYYGGPYYDFALIEAYPDRMEKLFADDIASKIGAWAYFSDGGEYPKSGRLRRFYDLLQSRCQIERSVQVESFRIDFIRKPGCPAN